MNARSTLAAAAFTVAGIAAGAGGTAALTSGAHESITIAHGDTVQPRFSVRTDTVLTVAGNQIVATGCGSSNIFLRTWKGAQQISADTVDVVVPCVNPDSVAAVVIVCTQTDSQFKIRPLSGLLDSTQYAHAREVASCGPDSIPTVSKP